MAKKRRIFSDLISSITEEDRQRWRNKRLEIKKELTATYQLGYYVGAEIYNRYLPTLSSDMLRSRTVIEISEEDSKENKRLEEEWSATTQYSNKPDTEKNKEHWALYHAHNKMLAGKYLPNPLVCHLAVLNIEDLEEFKSGLIHYLWDCDLCSYSLKPEDIEIYDDEGVYSTLIKFKL